MQRVDTKSEWTVGGTSSSEMLPSVKLLIDPPTALVRNLRWFNTINEKTNKNGGSVDPNAEKGVDESVTGLPW